MKKTFYFDEEVRQLDEEKQIRQAEWMMKSRNPKVKKAGEYKYALLSGQLDELNNN